jgi:hypothetical protein
MTTECAFPYGTGYLSIKYRTVSANLHHKHHRQEYRKHDRHADTNRDSRLELRSLGDEFIVRADEAAKSVPDGMMRDLAIPILTPICGWASDRADPPSRPDRPSSSES